MAYKGPAVVWAGWSASTALPVATSCLSIRLLLKANGLVPNKGSFPPQGAIERESELANARATSPSRDRHMEEDNARLDRGVGNFLRQADVQLSADFLPISGQQPPPCSFVLFDAKSRQSRGPCAQPARHASFLMSKIRPG